jgi:hypothetical protein
MTSTPLSNLEPTHALHQRQQHIWMKHGHPQQEQKARLRTMHENGCTVSLCGVAAPS